MRDHVKPRDSEMPADGIQIVDVVRDAPDQFRPVGNEIGTAAIAHVIEDQRAPVGEALEIVEQIKPIRKYDIRAGSCFAKIQPSAVSSF
jgi:hypothetical protein